MTNEQTNSSPRLPYFVWFLGAFFFLVDYILRVSPSVLTPTLMKLFDANAFTIGGFSAFFYYAYIGMQIPVGILVDRFNPKILLIMSVLLCAGSTFMFAEMNSISMGLLSRLLMGFGASFAFVGTLKLISVWFKAEQFAFLAGLTQAMGMVGAMIGQGPMAHVYSALGWRGSMYSIGALFIAIAVFMMIFIKDKQNHLVHQQSTAHKEVKIWPSLKIILTNSQTWLNCLFIGFLYAPSACFGEQWGASFLSLNQGISIEAAGHETGMMFIGLAVGCPILGYVSDRLQRRLLVMRVSAVVCLILLSIVIYGRLIPGFGHISPMMYTMILFVYGFFNSGIVSSYALASEINPRQLTGIALGITNMASVIIGAAMIPIVGFVLDNLWNGVIVDHVRIFELREYHMAFLALPVGFVIAFITTFFQKETYCKQLKEFSLHSDELNSKIDSNVNCQAAF